MSMCRCPISCPHIEDLQQEGRIFARKARENRERLTLTLNIGILMYLTAKFAAKGQKQTC